MNDRTKVVAALVAAVAQIVGSPLGTAVSGQSVGDVSDGARSLVTPAGYAFSIWGVIFLGALAWSVYQALPSQRENPVHRAVRVPLAAAFFGNAVWEVIYPLGGAWQYVANVLIFFITASAALAFIRLQGMELKPIERFLPAATTGLLLGWVTVAPVANVGNTGVALGADPSAGSSEVLAVAAMIAVALIGLYVVFRTRVATGMFVLAVAWGLVAIGFAGGPSSVSIAAFAAAGVLVAGLVVRAAQVQKTRALLVG